MNCPSCGHDNISGADTCAECGQSLYEQYREPTATEYRGILVGPLSLLEPRQPVCVPIDTSLAEVIARLKKRNVGCVLVTDDQGVLVGIFTERDVLYRVAGLIEDLESITVESLMTPRPTTLKKNMAICYALHLMGLHGFRHVPLVDDDNRPVGFISFRDIVRFIEKNFTSAAASS